MLGATKRDTNFTTSTQSIPSHSVIPNFRESGFKFQNLSPIMKETSLNLSNVDNSTAAFPIDRSPITHHSIFLSNSPGYVSTSDVSSQYAVAAGLVQDRATLYVSYVTIRVMFHVVGFVRNIDCVTSELKAFFIFTHRYSSKQFGIEWYLQGHQRN